VELRLTATLAQPRERVISAIVVGDQVCGVMLPPELAEGCRRLAKLAGFGIMGVDFGIAPNGSLYFASATPTPDLRLGGPALLDALIAELTGAMVHA